jgi:hypothetical protein
MPLVGGTGGMAAHITDMVTASSGRPLISCFSALTGRLPLTARAVLCLDVPNDLVKHLISIRILPDGLMASQEHLPHCDSPDVKLMDSITPSISRRPLSSLEQRVMSVESTWSFDSKKLIGTIIFEG